VHIPGTDEGPDERESLVSVPMFDGERVLGVITIGKFDAAFSADDLEKLTVFARQAEIAVKRARNAEELARSEKTYRSLYETTLALADSTDLEFVIGVICDQATRLLDSIYCTYFTYDPEDCVLVPFYSNAPVEREAILDFRVPLGVGLSGKVAADRAGAYSNYTDPDRPVVHVEGTDGGPDEVESVISCPVMDSVNLLGVITIGTENQVYTDSDLAKLSVFTRLASIAIKRAENRQALERSENTYRTLYETTMTLADETELEKVLGKIADNAQHLMDAHFCNILTFDAGEGVLTPIYTTAPSSKDEIMQFRVPLGVGLAGKVAQERRGAYSNYCDPDRPVVHIEGTDSADEHRESVLAEPILDGETLLGVFLIHALDRVFTDDDLVKVRVFARLTFIALKRTQYIQALSSSEERFRQVAASSGDWIWEVDAEGRYTYASPVVEQVLGYTPDDVIGKHFYDLFVPEEREEVKRAAFEAFARKEPILKFENRNVHKDGRVVILETNGVPLLSEDGALLGYRGLDRDVTEKRRAEELLRSSEERYRSIWNKSPIGICLSDRHGECTMVNPALAAMLGYEEEELIGRKFYDLIAAEEPGQMGRLLEETLDTQIYQDKLSLFSGRLTELLFIKKTGEELPVEVKIDFITRGESVQYMISLVTDITERKRAAEALANYSANLEREVEAKTAELSTARRFLREVIDASPDLVTVADAEGRLEILNRAATAATGYTEEELRGKPMDTLYFDRDREVLGEMTRRLTSGLPSTVRQFDLRTRDGSPFPVELSVSPLVDPEGEYTGSVAVGRDIRELEGLRRALSQSEKLAATGKLAADIAHEVNNPLAIINNYIQIAKRGLEGSGEPSYAPGDTAKTIGIIEEEVQRIARIISGLLDFYRPESAYIEKTDVNQLICDLLMLVSIQLEKAG
ncbi:MAG TPA: PAS domain S-box protein, partial [Candidatus Coatesbacteria bacterium]|nr:PAS domain S-box protein [Candidatus Coatesbacteria bacterium]